MKNKLLTFLFFLGFVTSLLSQTMEEYLENIAQDYDEIAYKTWVYTKKAKQTGNLNSLEKERKEILLALAKAKIKLIGIGSWKEDSKFQQAVMSYYKTSHKVLSEDFSSLLESESAKSTTISAMKIFLGKERTLRNELLKVNYKAASAKETFIKSNKINVNANEMGLYNRMKRANEAYDYYDKVFLLNFEASFYEKELISKLKTKDTDEIERIRLKLAECSNTGITAIKSIGPFKKDKRMLMPTTQLLTFYKKESEQLVPNQIVFFKSQADFQEQAKNMEANKKRTKKEVQDFKEKMRKIKSDTELYNRENHKMNARRAYVVNVWNNDAKNFIDLNVPK